MARLITRLPVARPRRPQRAALPPCGTREKTPHGRHVTPARFSRPAVSPSRRRRRPTTRFDPVPSVCVSSAATRSPLIVPRTSEPRSSCRTASCINKVASWCATVAGCDTTRATGADRTALPARAPLRSGRRIPSIRPIVCAWIQASVGSAPARPEAPPSPRACPSSASGRSSSPAPEDQSRRRRLADRHRADESAPVKIAIAPMPWAVPAAYRRCADARSTRARSRPCRFRIREATARPSCR